MAGTFTLRNPIFFGEVGDWAPNGIGYDMKPDGPKTGILTSTFIGASQVVSSADGTFAVAAAPAGFQPTTNLRAHLNWSGSIEAGASMVRQMLGQTDNTTDAIISVVLPNGLALSQLIAGFWTFECTLAMAGIFQSVYTEFTSSFISVTGDYSIFQWQYDMPQDGDDIDLQDNRLITITSPGTNPLTDLNLAQLTIAMGGCPITIVTQTPTLLIFSIPDSCSGDGVVSVVATGNGTQFSGSVTLGSLNILLTNASGIYTLVRGKTSDTLYSSLRDGSTYNVKIPNPFAKIGFIGG